MGVGSGACVVCKIPAGMIRVVVDHDVIRIPEPAIDIAVVVRCDAEVEAAEPESRGAATSQVPVVRGTESADEMTVFPGMVEVIVCVIAASVVADPMVIVDMRSVGVAWMIGKVALIGCAWSAVEGFRAAHGSGMATAVFPSTMMLRECGNGEE